MIQIKTKEEIKKMREVGKYHAEIVARTKEIIKSGISTAEIDKFVEKLCKELNVIPAQIGYKGYQYATCIGLNDDGVHCFPRSNKIIRDGDIVTVDFVIKKNGFHADGGFSLGIGEIDSEAKRLMKTTRKALKAAIRECKEGNYTNDISTAVYKTARDAGFDVLHLFSAHGIGRSMHEDPLIPNFPLPNTRKTSIIHEGMCFALDTMLVEKSGEVDIAPNGWETRTQDGGRFAFFEHTVVVGKKGGEILTQL